MQAGPLPCAPPGFVRAPPTALVRVACCKQLHGHPLDECFVSTSTITIWAQCHFSAALLAGPVAADCPSLQHRHDSSPPPSPKLGI